ncbi:hypothetical protein VO64_5739 [Pseudomonas synxantha]|uniref:Uncharacterized protein n=1 Tax=Pseudomonas synxantha TaxID=47883 RepID=A0AAU8TWB6_9PSED|nr:hypothetical protein VO64_5739 [Pseudomonas synxantha]
MAGVYVQRDGDSMVQGFVRKKDCTGRPGLWHSVTTSLEWRI